MRINALERPQLAAPRRRVAPEDCALAAQTLVFNPSFAGLVVFAGSLNPIPSRTRPLNSPAPMVLSLKAWKSRSLPGLPRTFCFSSHDERFQNGRHFGGRFLLPLLFLMPRRPQRRNALPECFRLLGEKSAG